MVNICDIWGYTMIYGGIDQQNCHFNDKTGAYGDTTNKVPNIDFIGIQCI